ncbi:5-dehydro-4-deoxyglucarate dehydratase [Nesterenkonia cremea]|uniref:Probable 5-dehydro-4-deoxyglucarate dehydratase n=1 Tax=Nesterenkonia cremea TaxID=1882340 RepID=A0A917AKE9_9MICC|nr:5-dehydro-4-deoxyglucarate dehydratase [Nesterenkonia cremea]GGE57431.1 putative 5-dehydro-4-deoxyglucarate dehydratase [Nesterenkonia cremea]
MPEYSPADLAETLKDGLLSFPVTPFTESLAVDESALVKHLEWQSSYDIGGLFVAGGTGEGFSLTLEESRLVVSTAAETVRDGVPVLGSATGNTAQAVEFAQMAETAGADGLLLLPPYLTETTQEGLRAHAAAVLESTDLGVILYNRANAIYSADTVASLAEAYPNLIGFKDGVGNFEQLARVTAACGDRLFYLGGLPTAETYALSLLKMGMSTYSSAMFNFLPEFALEFYRNVRAEDQQAVQEKLRDFVLPYLDIRDRGNGYGVSIVKAGLRAVGRDAGPVRPPLRDLSAEEQKMLNTLIGSVAPAAV